MPALDRTNLFARDGGDAILIHNGGDISVYSDEGTTAKLTIDGATGNTAIAGTLGLTGAVTVGTSGAGVDVTLHSGTAGDQFLWDASEECLVITGTNAQTALSVPDGNVVIADNLTVSTGAFDVTAGATTLEALTVGANDTGADVTFHGDTASANLFWDASDDALEINGDARIDLSGCTVGAAKTDGGIIKAGTSSARVTEDTPDMKFISLCLDDGATSGEAIGIYDRLYVTGAGGSGTALRAFCTVENVEAVNARGAHISLSFGASGTVTGSGQALTTTLHIPDDATQGGHLSAITTEIYSDGDTSDPAGSTLSCIRMSNAGGAGKDDVDDDCAAIHFDAGWTVGDGNMIAVKAAAAAPDVTHSIRIRLPDGSAAYLYAGATALTAS